MAKPLWITYAWADNKEGDFDHLINELRAAGIDTQFDRIALIPGQRLWDQIANKITTGDIGGWAYLVTPNSLASEPCKEELSYALDRALSVKGGVFPIVGLMHNILAADLPPPLKVRLSVPVGTPGWIEQIKAALEQRAPVIEPPGTNPFKVTVHKDYLGKPGLVAVEFTPRFGELRYWRVAYPQSGPLAVAKSFGPAGGGGVSMVLREFLEGTTVEHGHHMNFFGSGDPLSPHTSAYAAFQDGCPDQIWFGWSKEPFGMPSEWHPILLRTN